MTEVFKITPNLNSGKKAPLVSVLIPAYNVAPYLDRCLKSLAAQIYQNFKVIIIDDGSTDGSREICRRWCKRDERFFVESFKNHGLAASRNRALARQVGKYVCFVDADDWVEPDYLKTLVNLAERYRADIAITSHRILYPKKSRDKVFSQLNSQKICAKSPKQVLAEIFYDQIDVSCWGKLYRSKLFDDIKYPEGQNYEDAATTPLLIAKAHKIALSPALTYNYEIKPDSITTSRKNIARKVELITATDVMCDQIIKQFPDLTTAALVRRMDARLSTLAQLVVLPRPPKKLVLEILDFVKANRATVLKNPRTPVRTKLALQISRGGFYSFRFAWRAYLKITGKTL